MNVSKCLAAALAAVLGLLPVAPPEHVHEAEDHGHVHLVIHRHLSPHAPLASHDDADHRRLDDDDGPVLTLTTVYNVPAPPAIAAPARAVAVEIEPPASAGETLPTADVEILIHGPPRAPTSLRAPPFPPSV